jgi:hypothetical protein
MPSEAPCGHGRPPEPFVEKASKYQIHGPEQREAGEGHPPGDAIPKEGKGIQIHTKASPH